MGRKVLIVFEETDVAEGHGFNVYLDGLDPLANQLKDPEEQARKLSRADFWALRSFQLIVGMLEKCGALVSMRKQ